MVARRTLALLAVVASTACGSGCVQDGIDAERRFAALDQNEFGCRVEPVLVASCGQLACHGDGARAYQIYGRGRNRSEGIEIGWTKPLTDDERRANFDAAVGFVDPDGGESLLLLKPLDSEAGGYFHRGKDLFGDQDVFTSDTDPDFLALESWVNGAKEAEPCVQPE